MYKSPSVYYIGHVQGDFYIFNSNFQRPTVVFYDFTVKNLETFTKKTEPPVEGSEEITAARTQPPFCNSTRQRRK